jgi:succinate dehydrogenase/fumarate reductase flavoprotein subunit
MREKHNWDKQVDVLVVGTGFAGLSAAIEAGEAGKKVLVIEKMKAAGGNSIISDGGIAAPGTLLQEEHRIEPRFYVSTSKSIIKALINMRSFEIQLSPIG